LKQHYSLKDKETEKTTPIQKYQPSALLLYLFAHHKQTKNQKGLRNRVNKKNGVSSDFSSDFIEAGLLNSCGSYLFSAANSEAV